MIAAMISFVFWNLMGHQADGRQARLTGLRRHLEALAATCDVDVLLVAESAFPHREVVDALNGAGAGVYHWPSSPNRRVHVYRQIIRRGDIDVMRGSKVACDAGFNKFPDLFAQAERGHGQRVIVLRNNEQRDPAGHRMTARVCTGKGAGEANAASAAAKSE